MKNKKGFTLMELLAVIVILAVLALITTPIILSLINETKINAFKDSVSMAIRSSDLYTELNNVDLTEGISVTDLDLSHSDLKYGTIILNNKQLEAINVSNGDYCANGNLGALVVYKGECDTTIPQAPSVTSNETYSDIVTYTIEQNGEITSGIDYYEYFLSNNELYLDTDEDSIIESSINVVTIDSESTYVHFRIVSKAGKKGIWANVVNYVDVTAPIASLDTSTITSKSIELTATCLDPQSGITKYEFSKDNGGTYIDNGLTLTYTFDNLLSNTYLFKTRCTNGVNLTNETSIEGTTSTITIPTYVVTPTGDASSKTVTITYSSGYTNEYSINGGTTWISYTEPVVFNTNGSVIARSSDGVNNGPVASYTITGIDTTLPVINNISITSNVATFTLTDNSLIGYQITTSDVTPTTWTTIIGTSYSGTYTASAIGTYYVWVKDSAGNISHTSFDISTLNLIVIQNGVSVNSKAVVSNATVAVSLPYIGNTASGRNTSTTKTSFTLNNYTGYTSMKIEYTYQVAYSYGSGIINFNGTAYHSSSSYTNITNTITIPITSTFSVYCYTSSNIGYASVAAFYLTNVTLIK